MVAFLGIREVESVCTGKETMPSALYLTQDGLDKLDQELKELKGRRKDIIKRIQEAKEFGDLSENSEYDDAKNEQAFVEGRIQEIEEVLSRAKVISTDNKHGGIVVLGSKVIVEADGEETFTIVGATEADPLSGKISADSPTGKALMGRKIGEKVSVQAPSGTIEYTVKAVKL